MKEAKTDLECNLPCMTSIHTRCRCSCGGANHGIEGGIESDEVRWKPPPPNARRTLRQESKAGQLFMFDIAPKRRQQRDRHGNHRAAAS